MRQSILSGMKWEPIVGYSRAVRVGKQVFVTGTTSAEASGEFIGEGDPYAQTKRILEKIAGYLEQVGAEMTDVVRTRMFVTDISRWEEIGRAHSEFFGEIRPAATMVQVTGLIDPRMMVEIEVDAVID